MFHPNKQKQETLSVLCNQSKAISLLVTEQTKLFWSPWQNCVVFHGYLRSDEILLNFTQSGLILLTHTKGHTNVPLTTHIPSPKQARPTDESCHASPQSALSCHLPALRHVVSVGALFCSALQMCEKQTDVHVCGPPCFCADSSKIV